MPLNLSEIDQLIQREMDAGELHNKQSDALKFVREKLLHGTNDEKRLIQICSQLTIDNLNVLLRNMKQMMNDVANY